MTTDETASGIRTHDWQAIEDAYFDSEYGHVVVDDFLDESYAHEFRNQLVSHWAWRHKTWLSQHLHNSRPNLPQYPCIASTLIARLPRLFSDMELVDHWALLYTKNTPGRLHADAAGYAVSLWLTPEEYNEDPETGGLLIYDVKRPVSAPAHLYLLEDFTEEYLRENTRGGIVRIPYRFNRLVIFDGANIHRTDELHFRDAGADSHRLNAAFAINNRAEYERRVLHSTKLLPKDKAYYELGPSARG